MKIEVKDINGKQQGEIEPGFALIENGKGTQAVHEVVVAYRAAQRSGTACAKTKGEVAGSGAKPWRQKGTGRARAGYKRSPVWRGGGVVFGPRPRDFSKKVNKKTRRLAFRKALSERLQAGEVIVLDELKLDEPKTRRMASILDNLGVDGTVLVVVKELENNVALACRNIPHVEINTSDLLNTYDVLKPDRLVITKDAFEQIGERLNKD